MINIKPGLPGVLNKGPWGFGDTRGKDDILWKNT
jgi:hypothetical protein